MPTDHSNWRLVVAGLCLWLSGCQLASERSAPDAAISASTQAQFERALEAMHNDDFRRAEQELAALLEQRPELSGAWINLGHSYLAQDRRDSARDAFDAALQHSPDDCRALNALGVMARQEGEFAHAERKYRRCLDAQPNFREALLNLAILYELYLGRLEEALTLYQRYQTLLEEPDPRVNGWLVDLQRRVNGRAG